VSTNEELGRIEVFLARQAPGDLAETELRRKGARARILGAKPGRSALERAKDLVAAGHIQAANPADEFAATREEEGILREANRRRGRNASERAGVVGASGHRTRFDGERG
jgi:hypothetical protein